MKSPKLYIKLLITTCMLLLTTCVCYTSHAQELQTLLDSLNSVYEKAEQQLSIENFNNNDLVKNQIYIKDSTPKLTDLKVREAELERKQLLNDIGLSFKASGNYNTNAILDGENNEFITSRVRTELEWNILKNGYVDRRNSANQLSNTIALLKLNQEEEDVILWRRKYRLSYTYAIHKELIHLCQMKSKYLNDYYDILSNLYQRKLINREKIITFGEAILINERELDNYQVLNETIKDSIFEEYRYIRLPFMQLTNDVFNLEGVAGNTDSLRIDIMEKEFKWYNDISLSIYANQNWISSNQNNRTYSAIGFRLRVPLKFGSKKELLKTKTEIIQRQEADKDIGTYNTSLTHYNAYREKIKDLSEKYKTWKIIEERKRKLHFQKEQLGYVQVGLLLMESIMQQFDVLEDMLTIKRQVYTHLSHLYQLDHSLRVRPYNFENYTKGSVLVKNSSQFSMAAQVSFMELKDIQKVFVQGISDEYKNQLKASGFNVEVYDGYTELKLLEDWMKEDYNAIKTLQQ